ncbi:co-chaperone protein p23-1-like [Macadamia integrifolia]|uniref:co-chaperone protein p23-1-like n=1 Tax=Macadamia integrifolia TaxID=60698 RepID=UPI001C4F4148|nr:co-chaperone protein p23-1-like [Macadamia integrifolia]
MSRHPTVKWAQRSDKIYLTVELPDAKDVKLKLEPEGRFIFSATKDGVPYEVDIELYDKINVEESKVSIGVRNIVYVIKKSEKKWWGKLVKQEGKPPVFVKVDWDKWVDEDEENEKAGMDFDDMDFSNLDMGGDDYDDMDELKDEEEETEAKEKEETKKEGEGEPAAANAEETKA